MSDILNQLKLVSNLVVMGIDVENEILTYKRIKDNLIKPVILDIYPEFEADARPPFLDSFEMWTFPTGFKIYDENFKSLNVPEEEPSDKNKDKSKNKQPKEVPLDPTSEKNEMFSFVMTDGSYQKRYCTTLLIHERCYIKNDQNFNKKEKTSTLFPKSSIQNLSKYPFQMPDHDLIYYAKSITLISDLPAFDVQKQLLKYLYNKFITRDKVEKLIRIPKKYISQLETLIRTADDEGTSVDDQWQENFVYDRVVYMKNYIKEEEYSLKESSIREFYLSAFFSVLDLNKGPAEKVILKLIDDEDSELLRYRIYQSMTPANLPMTSFKSLFRKLSAGNILKIFRSMLLERQILFFSNTPGEIAYVTEAFLCLLSPLTWNCVYIPNLPGELWETCHALMPFIIGIHNKYRDQILENVDCSDKIIVDLDHDKVTGTEKFEFPKKANDYISSKLKESSELIRNMGTKTSEMIWVQCTLKTRNQFHLFLLMLFNNYTNYFIFPETNAEKNARPPAAEVFDFEQYLKHMPTDYKIMKEIHQTMMFTNFVEESYELLYDCEHVGSSSWDSHKDEVTFFIKCLKEVKKEAEKTKEILQNYGWLDIAHPKAIHSIDLYNGNYITESTKLYYAPDKIDLYPYFLKYWYKVYREKMKDTTKISNHSRNTSLRQYSNKEVALMNRQTQAFPKLSREKILDLKKIFSTQSHIRKVSVMFPSMNGNLKFPIFSASKEIFHPIEPDLDEAQKENAENLDNLRKSNYYLYYQMIKRNDQTGNARDQRRQSELNFVNNIINEHQLRTSLAKIQVSDDEEKKPEVKDWTQWPNRTPSGGKISALNPPPGSIEEPLTLRQMGEDLPKVSDFALSKEPPPLKYDKSHSARNIFSTNSSSLLRSETPTEKLLTESDRSYDSSKAKKLIFQDSFQAPLKINLDVLDSSPTQTSKTLKHQKSMEVEVDSSLENLTLIKYAKSTIGNQKIRTSLGDTGRDPQSSPSHDKKKVIFEKKNNNTVSMSLGQGKENYKNTLTVSVNPPTRSNLGDGVVKVEEEDSPILIKNLDTGEMMTIHDLEKSYKNMKFK